jgi:lysophospholipase L1-like esterase
MKLTFDKIKDITTGVARIEEQNGEVSFFRYTKAQDERYQIRNPELRLRSLSTAGVKLCFDTDSKNLFLNIVTRPSGTRKFFSVDVLVNGEPIGYIDNFEGCDLSNYFALNVPDGEFSKSFELGEGRKRVCIRLPWNKITSLKELSLDDGAFVEGVRAPKRLLAFGDSITQGYDALRPSDRYAAKLADALGADEYNKAIGGDIFFPDLAALRDDFTPDIVTVAYGTNDWNCLGEEEFKQNCRGFYKNLAENYPNTKIFAIAPIWRADYKEGRGFGDFLKVSADIKEATKDLPGVIFVDGFDFVPHDRRFYSDQYLHPNSEGFEYYFKSLYAEIKKYL